MTSLALYLSIFSSKWNLVLKTHLTLRVFLFRGLSTKTHVSFLLMEEIYSSIAFFQCGIWIASSIEVGSIGLVMIDCIRAKFTFALMQSIITSLALYLSILPSKWNLVLVTPIVFLFRGLSTKTHVSFLLMEDFFFHIFLPMWNLNSLLCWGRLNRTCNDWMHKSKIYLCMSQSRCLTPCLSSSY